jgi:hypothetical protein
VEPGGVLAKVVWEVEWSNSVGLRVCLMGVTHTQMSKRY